MIQEFVSGSIEFECSICGEKTKRYSYICENNHSTCNQCYLACAFSTQTCPFCRLELEKLKIPTAEVCIKRKTLEVAYENLNGQEEKWQIPFSKARCSKLEKHEKTLNKIFISYGKQMTEDFIEKEVEELFEQNVNFIAQSEPHVYFIFHEMNIEGDMIMRIHMLVEPLELASLEVSFHYKRCSKKRSNCLDEHLCI